MTSTAHCGLECVMRQDCLYKMNLNSSFLPSPPQRRLLRRAKKRKRSPGDLVKRRQRHLSYQLQTPPSTPCPEPDQSTLESGMFGVNRNICLDLFPPWTLPVSSPQSWLPPSSSWCTPTPSPGPCPPTPWLSSNMAESSPVYCDGCNSWGNFLTVTVSQSRAL